MSRQGWPATSEEIYHPQCSNIFIQVRNICCTGSLCMGGGTIFKVGATSARQKNYKISGISNWQQWHHKHWSMFKQFYSKFDKLPTTRIYTRPYLSYTAL